jgi:RNA polymerase sigma-70 factor, ECF subfamily
VPESDEETQLLTDARAGDRAAYDGLVARLEPRVRAFVLSRIHPEARPRLDLDEIVQDTFVRAYESLRSFRGDDMPTFSRWLMGIARIAVIRAARPPGAGHLGLGDDVIEGGASPSAALRRDERFERLQSSLDSLSGDYREVLYLARIEGLSMQEIADRMGRSPEAVKKLFGRALAKLRERFGDTESLHLPDRQLHHLEGGDHED